MTNNYNSDQKNENHHHGKNGTPSNWKFNKNGQQPFNNRRSKDPELNSTKLEDDDWSDETTSTAPPSGEFKPGTGSQNTHSAAGNRQVCLTSSPNRNPEEMSYPPPLIPDFNISSISTEILKSDEPEVNNNNILLLINLPKDVTFMNIVHLVEDFNPVHISVIKTIYLKNDNFKYCRVYLATPRDAKLASAKLDGSKFKENKILVKVLSEAFSVFKIN